MRTGYGFPSGWIFAQPLAIGGHGGTEFTECKTDTGSLVKRLRYRIAIRLHKQFKSLIQTISWALFMGPHINPTVELPSLQTRSSLKLAYGAMELGNDLGIFNS